MVGLILIVYAVIGYKIDGVQVATVQYHVSAPYSLYASCKLLVYEEGFGENDTLSCNVAYYM